MNNLDDHFGSYHSEVFKGEAVGIYVQHALSKYKGLASNSEFRVYTQAAVDQMVMQIISWCASGRIPSRSENFHFEYPDGVWQTFKHLHFPYWLKQRFPVRMKNVDVEKAVHHYFVCPHANIAWEDDKAIHIQFMATGTPLAERVGRTR